MPSLYPPNVPSALAVDPTTPGQTVAPKRGGSLMVVGGGGTLQMLLNPDAACWQRHGVPLD